MKRSRYALPYQVWMALFIIVPIFIVLYYACTTSNGASVSFSLENLLVSLHIEETTKEIHTNTMQTPITVQRTFLRPQRFFLLGFSISFSSV